MSKLEAILEEELQSYASIHGLSKRETEILMLMLKGITSSEGVSTHLGISPNTTNNHVKSILDKTNSSSKTELLSRFLENLMQHYTDFRLFSRRPRVLIVDDEPDICEVLAEDLAGRGLKTFTESNPIKAAEQVASLHVDFLIVDIKMPGMDGFEVLKDVRSQFPHYPIVFMMTGFSSYTKEECLNEGAAAFFAKPIDVNQLFYSVLEHYMESESDNMPLRADAQPDGKVKQPKTALEVGNFGYGGVFVPVAQDQWGSLGLSVGDWIEFSTVIAETEILVRGQVLWLRKEAKEEPAGFGLRFRNMAPEHIDAIHVQVRKQKAHSFVPSGPPR